MPVVVYVCVVPWRPAAALQPPDLLRVTYKVKLFFALRDAGRRRLRFQPRDVAWERAKKTGWASSSNARSLPQLRLAAVDAAAHEPGESPEPLLAELLRQVDSHVDSSYEHWFLPRKYTATPASLMSWRDGTY